MTADALAHVLDPSGKQNIQEVVGRRQHRCRPRPHGQSYFSGQCRSRDRPDPRRRQPWQQRWTLRSRPSPPASGVIGAQALPIHRRAGAKGQLTYCPYQSQSGSDEFCLAGSAQPRWLACSRPKSAGPAAPPNGATRSPTTRPTNGSISSSSAQAAGGGSRREPRRRSGRSAQTGFAISIH